jgi:hypothetical protein
MAANVTNFGADEPTAHQIIVRINSATEAFASLSRTINIPARLSPPNANNVVYNLSNDRITGVTNAMQFRNAATPAVWTNVTGTRIDRDQFGFAAAGAIHVRMAPTNSRRASEHIVVNVASPVAPTAPTGLSINWEQETLTGAATTMEVSTNNRTWTAVTELPFSVSSFVPRAGADEGTLYVRFRAVPTSDDTSLASDYTELTLRPRAEQPPTGVIAFRGLPQTAPDRPGERVEFRSGQANHFNGAVTQAQKAHG